MDNSHRFHALCSKNAHYDMLVFDGGYYRSERETKSGMGCPTCTYDCYDQVSTNVSDYNVLYFVAGSLLWQNACPLVTLDTYGLAFRVQGWGSLHFCLCLL